MSLQDIKFTGLIKNRRFSEIGGPEFLNALQACGWKEGTNTHFYQQLKKDGPSRGIDTPGDLEKAIAEGRSEPGREGKTIHRMISRYAYIVYNADTRTLITFSPGNPPRWDVRESIRYLQEKARPPYGIGKCATFVREALEAGGLKISRAGSGSAKDYGPRLTQAGFVALTESLPPYQKGDVAVINGFTKKAGQEIKSDHVDGHVALFDGSQWLSDFKQHGMSPYPGSDYEKAKPPFTIYRYRE